MNPIAIHALKEAMWREANAYNRMAEARGELYKLWDAAAPERRAAWHHYLAALDRYLQSMQLVWERQK